MRDTSLIGTYRMGERVQVGPLVYQVLESDWRSELGPGGKAPKNRFLFVKVSITNSTGSAITVPGLTALGPGTTYIEETENMDRVENWLGLIRNIQPSQTEQGWIVFDAPIASYKLALTDAGEIGKEKFAHVEIPVQLE